eukprot:366052-Chlamydomonas_euryale.AAC.7
MKLLEQIGADPGGGGKAPKALIPKAADADDEDEDESESSSSSGDDDDDVRHARGASGLFSPCMRQWFILTFHARRTRSHPACARDSLYPARAQMHALALWALIQRLWVVIHRQMHALALWVGIQRLWVVIQRLRRLTWRSVEGKIEGGQAEGAVGSSGRAGEVPWLRVVAVCRERTWADADERTVEMGHVCAGTSCVWTGSLPRVWNGFRPHVRTGSLPRVWNGFRSHVWTGSMLRV